MINHDNIDNVIVFIYSVFGGIMVIGIFGSMWIEIDNQRQIHTDTTPKIYYNEVKDLRCNGYISLGCTSVIGAHTYLIEYVPDTQRCNKSFCKSKNQTIQHELNHVTQYEQTGTFWEVDNI